jgi:broad specificity phosphatase PhoE
MKLLKIEKTIKLHLVRHAPVLGKQGFIYGDIAEVDLDSQVESLRYLSETLPDTRKAIWYSSGVDRATLTAEAVFKLKENLSVTNLSFLNFHSGFREQNFGSLIGLSHVEAKEYITYVNGATFVENPPSGETISNFVKRVDLVLKEVGKIALDNSINDIVVFCHRGTIRAANIVINKLPLSEFVSLDVPPLSSKQYQLYF